MNIIPGATTVQEAIALLKSKTNIYNESSFHAKYFTLDKIFCKIAIVDSSPYVAGIELGPDYLIPEARITLKEFVELFGEPCLTWVASPNAVSRHTTKLAFEYPLIRILCQDITDDDLSTSDAAITHILFAAFILVGRGMTPNPCELVNDPQIHGTSWHGFISVNEYRRLVWG